MNYVLEKDPSKSVKLRDAEFETYVQRAMKKTKDEESERVLEMLMKKLLSVRNLVVDQDEKIVEYEAGRAAPFIPSNVYDLEIRSTTSKEENTTSSKPTYRFPWIQLTASDERVLFDVGVKFKMLRPDSIREALDIMQNQVLEGFPAEVLLQQANLFEHVVASVSLSPLSSLNDEEKIHDMDLTHLGLEVIGLTGRKLMESVRLLSNTSSSSLKPEEQTRIPEANRRRNRWRYPSSASSKATSIPLQKASITAIVAALCLMKSPNWIDDAIVCARQWIPLLSVMDDDNNNNEIMTALADAVAIHEQHISNILLRGEITCEGVLSLLMFLPELFRDVPHDKSSLPRILKSLLLRVVSSQWLNEFQPSVRYVRE